MKKYIIALIPGAILYYIFYVTHSGEINLGLRDFGRVAFFYIVLSLSVSPFVKLLGNQKLLPYRRTFGVISFMSALVHTLIYFYYENLYSKTFFVLDHFKELDIISGVIALAIIIPLGLTSNNFSVSKMKTAWKKLQTLAYPLFLIVSIHIAFASRFESFYMVLIGILVMLRSYVLLKEPNINELSSKVRYLCVPCGYIYDQELGDPDSGIAPGTKFEDIPETWRCPVCGVTKSEFIKLSGDEETKRTLHEFNLESKKMLTKDVMELKISSLESFFVNPGQFAKFIFNDEEGEFSRSYSVISYENGILTFGIKIFENGRGGTALKNLKDDDKILIEGIFGSFTLKNTKNDKVFIATGTGLSPIVNMIKRAKNSKKTLYFGVRKIEDIFYEEKIRGLHLLDAKFFISELENESELYIKGHIDIDYSKHGIDTEFYICGNPNMVKTMTQKLTDKGYKNIYSEQFN